MICARLNRQVVYNQCNANWNGKQNNDFHYQLPRLNAMIYDFPECHAQSYDTMLFYNAL